MLCLEALTDCFAVTGALVTAIVFAVSGNNHSECGPRKRKEHKSAAPTWNLLVVEEGFSPSENNFPSLVGVEVQPIEEEMTLVQLVERSIKLD